MSCKPIENKYCEGKMKGPLARSEKNLKPDKGNRRKGVVEGRWPESGSFEEGLQFWAGPRGGDEEERKRSGREGGVAGEAGAKVRVEVWCLRDLPLVELSDLFGDG
eukprot:CAMPEP_0170742260 /NCGR_PEP_ID=MMETSP0437-20130122/6651_1 /TAXON_ID=0 /ORGANISM="Sexangularia sp." /LENGTH=105 /DNA_ID=CAMNT_0011080873 /DNA_START=78 /DNA_END=392 /DNA_ORIENTATION=+